MAVGIVGIVMMLLTAVVVVVGVVGATHRARAAADLAALAEAGASSNAIAVGAASSGDDSTASSGVEAGNPRGRGAVGGQAGPAVTGGCTAAADVARANGADLVSCRRTGEQVEVEVAVPLAAPVAGLGPARARAKAGPGAPVGEGVDQPL